MDNIQKVLIKAGHKELAQEYFNKTSSLSNYLTKRKTLLKEKEELMKTLRNFKDEREEALKKLEQEYKNKEREYHRELDNLNEDKNDSINTYAIELGDFIKKNLPDSSINSNKWDKTKTSRLVEVKYKGKNFTLWPSDGEGHDGRAYGFKYNPKILSVLRGVKEIKSWDDNNFKEQDVVDFLKNF